MVEDNGYTDIVALLVREHYTWVLVLVILVHAVAILLQTLPALLDRIITFYRAIKDKNERS